MASRLKEEDLVLNIIVNGNKAQSEIGKVSRSLQDATAKGKDLRAEQQRLEKTGQTNSRRYQELTKEIERNNAVITEQKKRLGELNQSLSLEDKSLSQLRKSLTQLRRLRDQSAPNSQQWKDYNQQLQAVSYRMDELRRQGERTSGVLSRVTGGVRGFFNSALGGIATFTAVIAGVRTATDTFSEFDDVIADVMKTTNGTKEEVTSLNAELEKLDTRTSQNDLLGLARVGGKLGISDMDEIRGFVESTNQLVVALNEDLGGDVEGTVQAVGKLVDIFSVDEFFGYEQGLLKVGSAINELGAASTANEGNMVEFARRMAGVAPLAGISVQQILGLGATLDQLGQTSEVSSTALSKLFLKLASDAESFAKYAKMPVNEFKDLLEKDFLQAFTKVLEGVKDNSSGINELAATLGDLGLDGGRVIGVLGSLANNTHILTDQINMANDAFEKGTSLTDEYNIKNQTAQAQLEKSRKEVTKFWRELGERLWPAITSGNNLLVILLSLLSGIIRFISENIRVIVLLTASITAYTIAINASIIATKTKTAVVRAATAIQWLWNAAIAANPIGLMIAALSAVTTAIIVYNRRMNEAVFAQKALNDVKKEAEKQTAAEISEIERFNKILNDSNRSREDQLTALDQLRDIMPDVLSQYTDEQILAGEATEAINKQTEAIRRQAEVRVAQAKIEELIAKKQEIQSGDRGFMTGLMRTARSWVVGSVVGAAENMKEDIQDLRNLDSAIDKLTDTIINANKETAKINSFVVDDDDDYSGGTGKTAAQLDKEAKERDKVRKTELADAKKQYQQQLEAEGLFRKDQREMTSEELTKLASLQQAYQEKTDEINRKYQHSLTDTTNTAEAELIKRSLAERKYRDKLLDPSDPKLDQEKEQHQARLVQAGLFGVEMENLTTEQQKSLERLEAIHAENIGKIDAGAMKKAIEDRQHAFQEELTELRIQHNEELAEIKTLEQAKMKLAETLSPEALRQIKSLNAAKRILQNQYQQEEARLTRIHLEEMSTLIGEVLDSGQWEGIDLADKILSEDERKVLEAGLRKVREELSKLKNTDLTGDAESKADQDKQNRDILGMSVDDWKDLFKNLEEGTLKIEDLANAFQVATQVWSQYNAFVTAGEQRQLDQFEQANRKKREELDKRFQAGTIGQEAYNQQVEKLDKDLDRKRSKMQYEQAKRDRNVALASAVVNTAAGVARAFKDFGFPYSAIIAGIVGGLGAIQIGTIARTPLPSISGREGGGYMVRRSQDGKVFNADYDPDGRGYVGRPTVIVGENGEEFVASHDAVQNPTVKPVLDAIDTAQRNGTISTLNLEKVLDTRRYLSGPLAGREYGGSIGSSPGQHHPDLSVLEIENAELRTLVSLNTEALRHLNAEIRKGIKADVSLLGKNGFYEKEKEYKNIQHSTNL